MRAQTCKPYHELITHSSAIQLQIELEGNGFQVSVEAREAMFNGTAAQLLNEFKRYRDGWLYLKLGSALKIDPVDADMRLYELRQGFYAAALSTTHALPGIVKLIHLATGSTRLLTLGLNFSEFQIDPSQGLMVLVAIEESISETSTIHLRSVLDGSPHEGTQHPDWKIQLPFPMYRRSSGIFIEIMDDLLAVKYVSFDKDLTEILIWNWRRAILLNRIRCTGPSCTFGFLTPNSIILFQSASVEDPEVSLLVFDNVRTPRIPVSNHPGHYVTSEYEPLVPRVLFEFPPFIPGSLAYLLLRAEPAPTLASSGSAPFLPRPDARILQLSMTVIRNYGQARGLSQYQFFISKEKLLKHILPLDDLPEPSEYPIKVPWNGWGEYTTRLFETRSAISPWICRTYGTRFIQSSPLRDDEDELPHEYISVLDFHTPTVRRFSSQDEHPSMWDSKEGRRHIDLNSTDEDLEHVTNTLLSKIADPARDQNMTCVDTIDEDVPSKTPFNGDILVTRLPYRIVTRVQPLPKHSGWMMDNNSVIGMPGDDMENIQHEYMNIFTPYVQR
ncbi:hypothetical protein FRC12_018322 [Ceratobasidium sp. 428]|nr:hypothetical protein FRC12_018322 [Ceratobasidium sp. 428]